MKDGFIPGMLLDGRFQTLSPLNHGSFGMVFLAKDHTSGELVAIKCISKQSTSGTTPLGTPDHLLEIMCHDRMGHHPSIINLVHSFETDAHMFLVLDFCPMGDLYEAIRMGRGPLETETVRSFMYQLIDAVQFMHSKGLYHRDIKPENILLAQDGSMKLGDFGLSTTESWSWEVAVGSDRYMAPEQYDPSEDGYSPAQADTWAIGICLLNILFSRNPFVTPSEEDVLFRDFANNKYSLFDIFPAMSQDTFTVLEHAMALDPAKRSLTELRKSLGRVLSFTMDDDIFDEFCVEERDVVPASANRQPLRTPSIQSPPMESSGAFPWSKALQTSPAKGSRQLSAIPDYDEDMFPPERAAASRPSPAITSLDSMIDSALGASVKSITLKEPKPRHVLPSLEPATGSLPIAASKPMRALSYIFGKKDSTMSKSWSDICDEDEDEDEDKLVDARTRFNAQNFSTDSFAAIEDVTEEDDDNVTIGRGPKPRKGLSEIKNIDVPRSRTSHSRTPVNNRRHQYKAEMGLGVFGGDSSSEDVSFSFEEHRHTHTPVYALPQLYSPPAKRDGMDKWAALGTMRRNYTSTNDLKKRSQEDKKNGEKKKREKRSTAITQWRKSAPALSYEDSHSGAKENTIISSPSGVKGLGFNFESTVANKKISSTSLRPKLSTRERAKSYGLGSGNKDDGAKVSNKDIPKREKVRKVDSWRGMGMGLGMGFGANNNTTSSHKYHKDTSKGAGFWGTGFAGFGGAKASSPTNSDGYEPDNADDVDADIEWVGGWHDLHL